MPRMPLSGGRISCETMVRKRDLARLAASAWIARHRQRLLGSEHAAGLSVAADALHLALSPSALYRDLAPARSSAGAVGRCDFLVMGAHAVGKDRGPALLQHRKREIGFQELQRAGGRPARQKASLT